MHELLCYDHVMIRYIMWVCVIQCCKACMLPTYNIVGFRGFLFSVYLVLREEQPIIALGAEDTGSCSCAHIIIGKT